MSRSGYSDDLEPWDLIRWRGAVNSAIKGKRGRALLQKMADALDALRKGATCPECNRGWKGVVQEDANSTGFEIVQTSGPDAPEWLPKMRRSS